MKPRHGQSLVIVIVGVVMLTVIATGFMASAQAIYGQLSNNVRMEAAQGVAMQQIAVISAQQYAQVVSDGRRLVDTINNLERDLVVTENGAHTQKTAIITVYTAGGSSPLYTQTVSKDKVVLSEAPSGKATYTAPGAYNWTVPTNVTTVFLSMTGGGGGGGAGVTTFNDVGTIPGQPLNSSVITSYGGFGGGGGQAYVRYPVTVTPGQLIPITVGAGGAVPPQDGWGGDGGNTVFGSIIAYGGKGGAPGQAVPPASSGLPGGNGGTPGGTDPAGNNYGGDTPFGRGGVPMWIEGYATKAAGSGYGAAGAGGWRTWKYQTSCDAQKCTWSVHPGIGGAGAGGFVLIEW